MGSPKSPKAKASKAKPKVAKPLDLTKLKAQKKALKSVAKSIGLLTAENLKTKVKTLEKVLSNKAKTTALGKTATKEIQSILKSINKPTKTNPVSKAQKLASALKRKVSKLEAKLKVATAPKTNKKKTRSAKKGGNVLSSFFGGYTQSFIKTEAEDSTFALERAVQDLQL
jgi:polyhydroxyalkanoate synthesis regulator phasin